jgi:hypothetical protein
MYRGHFPYFLDNMSWLKFCGFSNDWDKQFWHEW